MPKTRSRKTSHTGAYPTRLKEESEIQFARCLGIVTASWAYAEEALTLILGRLHEVDHVRAEIIFYASKSEQFRIDLIRQLAKQLIENSDIRDELNNSLDLLASLIGKRNTFIHGLWKYNDRAELEIIPTKAGPLDWFIPRGPVSIKHLQDFANDIGAAEDALLAVVGSLPPLPKKSE